MNVRTYAAKAERDLRTRFEKFAQVFRSKSHTTADCLSRSVHFSMPDYGVILNDGFKGFYGEEEIPRLPYPSITLSYRVPAKYDREGIKQLLLCQEMMDGEERVILISPFVFSKEMNAFMISGICVDLRKMKVETEGFHVFYHAYSYIYMRPLTDEEADEHKPLMNAAVASLLEFLEALTCTNVTHMPLEKIDERLNARRIRDGKLPLYETRVLVIKENNVAAKTVDIGGSHRSPRQHLRRGHIRHLPGRNIWVNSCVVGKRTAGVIDKQYVIAA